MQQTTQTRANQQMMQSQQQMTQQQIQQSQQNQQMMQPQQMAQSQQNQQSQQNSNASMTSNRMMLSDKELHYIKDFLSWELLAMKKCGDAVSSCSDPEIQNLLKQTGQKHQHHFESLLTHLQ